MNIVDEQTIQLDRELSELDLFVLDFTKILEKYTLYVLVSGYVAILFGRSRTTEDVDLFTERMKPEQFSDFYRELLEKGYWALNGSAEEELFSLLSDNIAVRFAKKERY